MEHFKTKQKIIFRADGNSEIGLGHVIRSLALADMLKDDFECEFATRFLSDFIKREAESICNGIHMLPKDDSHFEEFLNLLSGNEIVVLDNYFFTTEYQKQIKYRGCKLVCIDDMHDKHYVADIVINHLPGLKREVFSCEPYTKLCLGLDYALLRKPFLEKVQQKREYKDIVDSIVVCFGGIDKLNLTEKICREVLETGFKGRLTAIIGGAYQYKDSLDTLGKQITIKENLSAQEMAEEFWTNDLAVVPCSSVLFEALACQVPVITGAYVDNQRFVAEYFDKNTKISVKNFIFKTIKSDDFHQKEVYSLPFNVENNFVKLFYGLKIANNMEMRQVRNSDVSIVFDWINDKAVRKNSYNSKPISFEEHKNWFAKKILDETCFYYIFEYLEEPMGQIRFDKEGDIFIISYLIAENYRGLSLGKNMIRKGCEKFLEDNSSVKVLGYVLTKNIASQKAFIANGFREEFIQEKDSYLYTKDQD